MFIAKFTQTSGAPFVADKHNEFPFIGDIILGTTKQSLVNGTMFKRDGYKTNTLYACTTETVELVNAATGEITKVENVKIISEVSILELMELQASGVFKATGFIKSTSPVAAAVASEGDDMGL